MTDNNQPADSVEVNQRGHFKGTNEQLCNSIAALLDLNDDGAVSHRAPGMAVTLLEASRHRLSAQPAREDALREADSDPVICGYRIGELEELLAGPGS